MIASEQLQSARKLPLAYIAWETDRDSCELTGHYFDVYHRGDIFEDDMDQLITLLDEIDPAATCTVVLTAGPPCVDYSDIKGPDAPGKSGPEGSKFVNFCKWQRELRDRLRDRPFKRLIENVLPHRRADIKFFEEELGCTAVIWDASDFQKVSRPRVWWSDIDWHDEPRVREILEAEPQWVKHFGTWKLKCPQRATKVHIPPGWQEPSCWAEGQMMPCLTTPAPTDQGRDAPRSARGKMSSVVYQRWIQGNRQFAPWHYESKYMLKDDQGEYKLPPITTKETLHEIPEGYTAGYSERTRHRWVANSWHIGMVKILLMLLLFQPMVSKAARVEAPMQDTPYPGLTAMQAIWHGHGPLVGPAHKWTSPSRALEEEEDMWTHWNRSRLLPDPRMELFETEPGLHETLSKQCDHSADLSILRARVCTDLERLKKDLAPEIGIWWKALPPHIQDLYYSTDAAVQVPVLEHLMHMFGWPDTELMAELSLGFPLLGKLSAGTGWPKREDQRYENPTSWNDFMALNEEYIHRKLQRHRVDDHWEVMMKEIADDVQKRCMKGPFTGPTSWPKKMVPAPSFASCEDLRVGPQMHQPTSVAFAIQQTGSDGQPKVRRGEDWRRSGHNSTVTVDDGPVNHRPDMFIAAAKFLKKKGKVPWLWGTDQEAAYRQLPVANPDHAWVILFTPSGPTLWKHQALLFGSVGSVWAYGRMADLLCWLGRTLLLVGALHFVDDYGAIEGSESADSSFRTIHQLWECLGLTFKESKKQYPGPEHRIQGVQMRINQDEFILAPAPERVKRMVSQLKETLLSENLTDEEAQRLAGKLQFMTETMMGAAMKSCLQPLYVRACQPNTSHLTEALKDSISTIIYLLEHQKPKVVPFDYRAPAVLYADAYFEAGDRKIKVGQADSTDYDPAATHLMKNGWDFVLHLPSGVTVYGRGELPGELMSRFTSNGAYIYALEILAQVMALVIVQDYLPEVVWAWIDNTAGQAALSKGYGRDKKINRLLAMLWAFLTDRGIEPFWRRVCSAANISDPISRDDTSIAKEHNWTPIEDDFNPIYQTLVKGLSSLDAALKTAGKLRHLGSSLPGASLWQSCRTAMVESLCRAWTVRPLSAADPKGSAPMQTWGEELECCEAQSICAY